MTADNAPAMPQKKKNVGTDKLPFAKILKGIMNERGLTLRQVAEMAGGVRTSVVHGWISGANPHDLHAISKLARALGISFKALLIGEVEDSFQISSPSELFDETELFNGICRVSISRLNFRKKDMGK